jgi:hypothetical protein
MGERSKDLVGSPGLSFFSTSKNLVAIGAKDSSTNIKEHLIHELGHCFEDRTKSLYLHSNNYVDTRLLDGKMSWGPRGTEIPQSNFKFPYAARTYRDDISKKIVTHDTPTEIVSVGFENLLTSANHFLNFARGDREHLLYTLHAITKGYE